jgi:hypothetical protein
MRKIERAVNPPTLFPLPGADPFFGAEVASMMRIKSARVGGHADEVWRHSIESNVAI